MNEKDKEEIAFNLINETLDISEHDAGIAIYDESKIVLWEYFPEWGEEYDLKTDHYDVTVIFPDDTIVGFYFIHSEVK